MRKLLPLLAMASVLIVSVGCELNITSDVYVSDLREVATNKVEGLTTPATIAVQIPSTDKCDEYSTRISEIMKDILVEFVPKTCKRDGMKSYLHSDTQIPLIGSEEVWQQSSSLFGIVAILADNGDIPVDIAINSNKFNSLNNRLSDEFHQTIDMSESKITLILNNDVRNRISYLVGGVFLNGEPIYYDEQYSLDRRHKAEIELSNVGAAHLQKNGYSNPLILLAASASDDTN